ncbi:MAG: ankyrin repeat domain-containing protein [Acidobacteriota bacterium]
MSNQIQSLMQRALENSNPEDLQAVGNAWASGLGTRELDPQIARTLVERGALLSPHAAAGLGLTDHLSRMLAADPALIDAKGCDACTPLHFARDVETAKLMLARGARIDARDEDHNSTPAQWLIGDKPDVVRYLLERGASADIFLAAALGDLELAKQLIAANPSCVGHRIGKAPEFPPLGHEHRGGTIYQWTLGFNSYAHQIALTKGYLAVYEYLYEQSDDTTKFLVSCLLAHREDAEALAARHPGLVAALPPVDHELVAKYCWETNTNYAAVKLMLDLGFPVAHPERNHGYTPLHNAAWAGSGDLVELLLERGHPVDIVDPTFHATPLGFMMHDCLVEKRHPEGEFQRVTKALLDAGNPWDALEYPAGDERIDVELRARLPERVDYAAYLNDEAAVFALLGQSPSTERLALALAGAAKGGHVELCRRLLDAGAPVNQPSGPDRETALMRAVTGKSNQAVALLLERGADLTLRHQNGALPLHLAIGYGASLETIALLLRSGASAQWDDSQNECKWTPLQVAEDAGREDAVKLLREFETRI